MWYKMGCVRRKSGGSQILWPKFSSLMQLQMRDVGKISPPSLTQILDPHLSDQASHLGSIKEASHSRSLSRSLIVNAPLSKLSGAVIQSVKTLSDHTVKR